MKFSLSATTALLLQVSTTAEAASSSSSSSLTFLDAFEFGRAPPIQRKRRNLVIQTTESTRRMSKAAKAKADAESSPISIRSSDAKAAKADTESSPISSGSSDAKASKDGYRLMPKSSKVSTKVTNAAFSVETLGSIIFVEPLHSTKAGKWMMEDMSYSLDGLEFSMPSSDFSMSVDTTATPTSPPTSPPNGGGGGGGDDNNGPSPSPPSPSPPTPPPTPLPTPQGTSNDFHDVVFKYLAVCSGVELEMNCLTTTAIDALMASGEATTRARARRFLGTDVTMAPTPVNIRPEHGSKSSKAPSLAPSMIVTPLPTVVETPPPTTKVPVTSSPTKAPTQAPVTPAPTKAPVTSSPTKAPVTPLPTKAPVTPAPTQAPITSSPTKAPVTPSPTQAPVTSSPTKAPVTPSPTQAPVTSSPTKAPVTPSPTQAPITSSPTKAPVTPAPTKAPVTSSPTKAPVTPSPMQAPVTPSPTKAPVTPSPTQAPVTSSPTKAPVTPSPMQAPVTSSPTKAPVTPSPTNAPTKPPVTPPPTAKQVTLSPTNAATMLPTSTPTEQCRPEVTDNDILSILTTSQQQCIDSGNPISDETFQSALSSFLAIFDEDNTCWDTLCGDSDITSDLFFQILFQEASECADVSLSVDDCILDHILHVVFQSHDSDDSGSRVRRSLQESCCESAPTESDLNFYANYLLLSADAACAEQGSVVISNDEWDTATNDLVKLFGATQCWGVEPCDEEEDVVSQEVPTPSSVYKNSAISGGSEDTIPVYNEPTLSDNGEVCTITTGIPAEEVRSLELSFYYQVETKDSLDLGRVERALIEKVCDDAGNVRRLNEVETEVVAVDASPEDVVSEVYTCTTPTPNTTCHIIDGAITIFLHGPITPNEESHYLSKIFSLFPLHLNGTHVSSMTFPEETTTKSTHASNASSSTLSAFGITAAATAFLTICLFCRGFTQRLPQEEEFKGHDELTIAGTAEMTIAEESSPKHHVVNEVEREHWRELGMGGDV